MGADEEYPTEFVAEEDDSARIDVLYHLSQNLTQRLNYPMPLKKLHVCCSARPQISVHSESCCIVVVLAMLTFNHNAHRDVGGSGEPQTAAPSNKAFTSDNSLRSTFSY